MFSIITTFFLEFTLLLVPMIPFSLVFFSGCFFCLFHPDDFLFHHWTLVYTLIYYYVESQHSIWDLISFSHSTALTNLFTLSFNNKWLCNLSCQLSLFVGISYSNTQMLPRHHCSGLQQALQDQHTQNPTQLSAGHHPMPLILLNPILVRNSRIYSFAKARNQIYIERDKDKKRRNVYIWVIYIWSSYIL